MPTSAVASCAPPAGSRDLGKEGGEEGGGRRRRREEEGEGLN